MTDHEFYDFVTHVARQHQLQRKVIALLEQRLEDNEMLLNSALHELAVALDDNPPQFIVQWMREHRRLDREGVPVERGQLTEQ